MEFVSAAVAGIGALIKGASGEGKENNYRKKDLEHQAKMRENVLQMNQELHEIQKEKELTELKISQMQLNMLNKESQQKEHALHEIEALTNQLKKMELEKIQHEVQLKQMEAKQDALEVYRTHMDLKLKEYEDMTDERFQKIHEEARDEAKNIYEDINQELSETKVELRARKVEKDEGQELTETKVELMERKVEKDECKEEIAERLGLELYTSARNGDVAAVTKAIQGGGNINFQKRPDELSPLYWACSKGHINVVKLLIKEGANVNIKDKEGWRPLRAARRNQHNGIAQVLEEAGAKE